MGTDHHLAHRYPPSTGKLRSRSPAGSPPCCHLLPAPLNGAVPHEEEMLSGCSAPTPRVPTAPPSPPHPCRDPGTQRASPGRRPRCEGQTAEAGPGTASPLVNSAGPCSLFKALNRGWYLSSPEFGAGGGWGGAGTGLTRSDRAGAVGGDTRYPRWEHVGGFSCRHMPFLSLPPTIHMVMRTN